VNGKYSHEEEMQTCNTCPYGKWTTGNEGYSVCPLIPTPAPTPVPTPVPTPAPTPIQTCSHTTCSFDTADASYAGQGPGDKVIVISHSSQEQFGTNHRCGIHKSNQADGTNTCTCTCFNNEYYAMMPGLGNTVNFGIATPAPTPREAIYSLSSEWTLSYFHAADVGGMQAADWQWAAQKALTNYLGILPSDLTMVGAADTDHAGSILTHLGPTGYNDEVYEHHAGVQYNLTISRDLKKSKMDGIKEQLEHMKSSPDEIERYTAAFRVHLATRSSAAPASFHFWLKSVGEISQRNNVDYWMGKCLAGEYPYKSDLTNTVECLPCPVGQTSEAGAKECFKA